MKKTTIEIGPYKNITVPLAKSSDLVDNTVRDILCNTYRDNPVVYQRNEKGEIERDSKGAPIARNIKRDIEEAYQTYFGKRFSWRRLSEPSQPRLLLGPPGQGKTSTLRSASAIVAELLNLNYVECPDESMAIHDNDLVYGSIEMAGEDSNFSVFGLPNIKTHDGGRKEMGRTVSSLLAKLPYAAATLINIDDITAADKTLTGALHSFVLERQAQGFRLPDRVTLAATGNLGRADGTVSDEVSSAMMSRFETVFMYLDQKDFIKILEDKYPSDTSGMSMLMSFLQTQSAYYNTQPKNNSLEAFSTPRSIEKLVAELVDLEAAFANNKNNAQYKQELERTARSLVGPDFGSAFAVHAYMYRSNAVPIARQFIANGKLDDKLSAIMDAEYKSGQSAGNVNFGTQIAFALADEAIRCIKQLPMSNVQEQDAARESAKTIIHNLTSGMARLAVSRMTETTLRRFMNRVGDELPAGHPWVSSTQGKRNLNLSIKMLINDSINRHPSMQEGHASYNYDLSRTVVKILAGTEGTGGTMLDNKERSGLRRSMQTKKTKEAEASPAP